MFFSFSFSPLILTFFLAFSLLKIVFPHYFSNYSSKNLRLFYKNHHLISHYSPSLASSPSPSSSSLSSPPLPPSTAFPFPFHVDLPTKPKCTRALLSDSTAPIRHSCPANCFLATLSHCSHNLRSAHHSSFTLQATSTLLHFPLAPNSTTPPSTSTSSLEGVS